MVRTVKCDCILATVWRRCPCMPCHQSSGSRLIKFGLTISYMAQIVIKNAVCGYSVVAAFIIQFWSSVVIDYSTTCSYYYYLRQGTSYQCHHPPNQYEQQIYVRFHISQYWQIQKTIPVSRWWSGSLPKFNRLFIRPFPTFPENFMQIR